MNLVAQIRSLGIIPAEDAPAQRSLDDLARKFPEPRNLARELIQKHLRLLWALGDDACQQRPFSCQNKWRKFPLLQPNLAAA